MLNRVFYRILRLTVSCVLFSASVSAQTSFGFGSGFQRTWNQDLILSPYVQRGVPVPLRLLFEKNNAKSYRAISADVAIGNLTSSVGNSYKYNQTGISFTWLKSLPSFRGMRPSIGVSWINTIINTQRSFLGQTEASWIGASALEAHGRLERGDRKKWIADVEQSLIAGNARPGYLNSPSDFKFGRLMRTKLSFSVQTEIPPLFTLRATASFAYLYSGRPTKDNAASVIDAGIYLMIMHRFTSMKNDKH